MSSPAPALTRPHSPHPTPRRRPAGDHIDGPTTDQGDADAAAPARASAARARIPQRAASIAVRHDASESAWREDYGRVDNGTQVRSSTALALYARQSVDFCGYWQRGR